MNDSQSKGINRQAWLIAVVFAVPMVAALLMTLVPGLKPEGGTRNYGDLIEPPRLVEPVVVPTSGGELWLRGRWTLLQPETSGCTPDCLANLGKAARLHQALGRHHQRLQRVLWSGAPVADDLRGSWPELQFVERGAASQLGNALDATATQDAGLILIDPQGYAMMRYPRNYDASAALKDLQRLMRYSKEEAEIRALEAAQAVRQGSENNE